MLPLSPALSEFGEEELNALKNIKDINVVDISTEVSSDEPKDKYTVTLDSVKNEIKKIQNLLLAPPVVQVKSFGDMINTQMGMSSAMVMDPSTRSQVSIMSNYFTTLGMLIFIYSGAINKPFSPSITLIS